MIYIETSRLLLRDWRECDTPLFQAMNSNPLTMEFFLNTLSIEESNLFLKRIKKEFLERSYGLYAVELKESGKLIGYTGFHYTEMQTHFAPCIEIGWRYLPEAWGHGYATEAAKACLTYAKENLDFKEVYSFTSLLNKRSEKVMKRLGMAQLESFAHPTVPDGHRLKEHVLYKITLE